MPISSAKKIEHLSVTMTGPAAAKFASGVAQWVLERLFDSVAGLGGTFTAKNGHISSCEEMAANLRLCYGKTICDAKAQDDLAEEVWGGDPKRTYRIEKPKKKRPQGRHA